MSQVFHPVANTLAKISIFGGVFIVIAMIGLLFTIVRSSYSTGVGVVESQPIPFSHQHHVSELGIDCRYCHTSVETSSFAGIPSSEICMTCHSQIWTDAPVLAPLRESYQNNRPLQWTRVYDLPDYVHFDHSIHVQQGVGCESCHGRIDQMPLTWKAESLHMSWCLDCHRHPTDALRPPSEVFTMGYSGDGDLPPAADDLPVALLDDCSICHQ